MRGLWRTEQALAVLANMLLGELTKEKGSVGVQDETAWCVLENSENKQRYLNSIPQALHLVKENETQVSGDPKQRLALLH